jgi:hypothetical protein
VDPIAWLEEQVYGFRDLAPADRDAINHFALLWALFEQRVLNTEGNATSIVAATATMAKDGRLDIARLAPALAYFRDRYFQDGAFTYHFEKLCLRRGDRQDLVEAMLTDKAQDPAELAAGVLIIIFRFRNNLHHGLKWAYGIQGQRDNFEHANAALMALMEMWGLNKE